MTKHNLKQKPAEESKGAIIAGLAANMGIAIAKFIAAILTNSSGMLAEAIHSVADSVNEILLLVGVATSKKKPTQTHPFGYGRAHFFYAFLVAILLFTAGGLFAIYDGVQKVQEPEDLGNPLIAYIVLLISFLLEGYSFIVAYKEIKPEIPEGHGLLKFLRQSKSVNHIVLILENGAALIGLILAATGLTLALITGDTHWDGWGSIAIGVLLIIAASFMFVEIRSLLIGEGADEKTLESIRGEILKVKDVENIVDLKTLYVGPAELFIAMKVIVQHDDQAHIVADAIDEIEARIRKVIPEAKLIYVEPDLYKTPKKQLEDDKEIEAEIASEYPELNEVEEQ